MSSILATNGETTTIPKWLWVGIGAVALAFAGALGTWVGKTLIDHESRIGRTEERVDGIKDRLDSIELKIDRLLERQQH